MKQVDEKEFIRALNALASTEDGQIVLAMLKDSCGWDKTYMASDDPVVSHYYAVKRGVYGGLRERIRVEFLKKIEFDYQRKVEIKDDRTSPSRARAGRTPDKPRASK
jgi:hypothetical protein